jgi:uncharacterized membrane protein YfcA
VQPWEAGAVLLAGVAAGAINAVVGSGTLITFPTLLALGFPPVTANVSNNLGLVLGNLSGAWGYRRELSGQRGTVLRLLPLSVVGAVAGALLLLWLPQSAFEAIVPVLIGLSLVLVVTQPWIGARLAERRARPGAPDGPVEPGPVAMAGVAAAGVYGGYFGAAQGVLLVGLLGSVLARPLQTVNGIKNVLSTAVNGVAAAVFIVVAPDRISWPVVALIAVGSILGGLGGAGVGRRLPPLVLRGVIVLVGVIAILRLLAA